MGKNVNPEAAPAWRWRPWKRACEIQMDALAMGRNLHLPPPEVCEHAARQFDRSYEGSGCELAWAANRRIIDRVNPGSIPNGHRATRFAGIGKIDWGCNSLGGYSG